MSDENYLSYKTKFKILATSQEKMPANLKEFDMKNAMNEAFLQHNSVEETKKEVALIDKLLSEEYKKDEETRNLPERLQLKLTEKDKMLLKNRKTLGLANLLLNNNTKEDSKEMADVKIDIVNMVKVVEQCRTLPPTAENLDKLEVAFRMAIDSCEHYCNTKNPHFKTGIERKRLVSEALLNLITEAESFTIIKRNILRERDPQKLPATVGEILGMETESAMKRPMTKKEAAEARKKAQAVGEQPANAQAQNEQVQNVQGEQKIVYPKEIEEVREIFGENYNFAQKIKGKYTSNKDRNKQVGKVTELLHLLRMFTPGSAAICNVEVMGKRVKLLQKSSGALFALFDHKEYPLQRTASTICMEIEDEIFSNAEVFKDRDIIALLDTYESLDFKSKMTAGEHNRIRGLLAKYLANKTNTPANDFNNTFRDKMVQYVRRLINGDITPEAVKKEVLDRSKNGVFINGVAVSEMAELNKNRSIDEISQMVEMNTQPKVEHIPPGWTEDEQHVKDMIADMIFTADTEKMEMGLAMPAKFLKDVIKEHKAAFEALLKSKNKEQDLDIFALLSVYYFHQIHKPQKVR